MNDTLEGFARELEMFMQEGQSQEIYAIASGISAKNPDKVNWAGPPSTQSAYSPD